MSEAVFAPLSGLDQAALSGEGIWAKPAQRLAQGIEMLGLDVSTTAQHQMLAYLALLARWNQAFNLTAITEPMAMVDRHLLDSLSIAPWIPQGLAVDAGTGAGLPGVVLAIAGFGDPWVVVDGNGKKIRFIRQACRSLALDKVTPLHGRIEAINLPKPPKVIVARALASLGQLVSWIQPWLDQGTVLLAMKADLQESEINEVPASYNVSIRAVNTAERGVKRQLALVGLVESVEGLEIRR